jgi:putative peptidoglycan lipid II flippase
MTPPRSLARAAAGMGAAAAVSRGFGFIRVLIVAAVLGTTYLGNTFQASNSVSNVLFEMVAAGALSAVLVPTFVEILDRGDKPRAEHLANSVLGLALVVLGAITVVGVLAAPWLAHVLSSGASNAHIAAQQEQLATYLLRFFIPQVLLYALGAVAIAVLYAQRRFVVTAAAPIANTVVIVIALVVFRILVGPGEPGLDLTQAEQLTLAIGGTLGVAAFVAVPTTALWRRGFRLRPRLTRNDPEVHRLLKLSSWAIFQNAEFGLLLGASLIVGNGVAGGVVAYQVAFVFFLAPYAVLAQPIHTTIHPELTVAAVRADLDGFARSLCWALDGMAVLVVPVSAGMIALSVPIMQVVAFGHADQSGGVGLLAAALASLSLGLFAYGAFLLFARAYYALGNSRTPAVVAIVTAAAGVVVMVVGGALTEGAAKVAALGIGNSVAYLLGATWLAVGLSRETGHSIVPRALPLALALAISIGFAAWWAERAIAPTGRVATLVVLIVITTIGAAIYWAGLKLFGGQLPALHPVHTGADE